MRRAVKWILLGALVLIAIGVVGALVSGGDDEPASDPPSAAAPPAPDEPEIASDEPEPQAAPEPTPSEPAPENEPQPEPEPQPESEGFGDGTYILGEDIRPGTYRSDGEGLCYWARLAGFSGELDDIIANGNYAPEIVGVARTDAGFETQGCGTWLRLGDTGPQGGPASEFGDGTYRVGLHIRPGTYRARGGDEICYWARLSDFSQELSGIITNGNNPTTIEIARSDVGFTTFGCGTWERR